MAVAYITEMFYTEKLNSFIIYCLVAIGIDRGCLAAQK